MNALERVMAAIDFHRPDRLPRWDAFDIFGDFPRRWRAAKNRPDDADILQYYGIDIEIVSCDEGPLYRTASEVERHDDAVIVRDGWGRVSRQRPGHAYFMETLQSAIEEPADLDGLAFDDPLDDRRYQAAETQCAAARAAGRVPFAKIGGLYCRTQFMRREDRLLMDMVSDEGFTHELFTRMADHYTRIGLEVLRRLDAWETGLWFYDDCANLRSSMFSPALWERYLAPLYARMIATFRAAGCRHCWLHSDGNIGSLIPLMLDVGFEGFNPLEPRAGLDLFALRETYGQKIVFFGGVCNSVVLPSGDQARIEAHVRPLLELGRDGGLIIGTHSIGDDISVETYDYYISLLDRYA